MQQINEHCKSAELKLIESSKKTTNDHYQTPIVDDAKQSKVFLAFRLQYGALWTDKIPESERTKAAFKRIWQYSLAGLSMDKVQFGIDQIVKGQTEFSTFPPNQAEFAEVCRAKMPAIPDFKGLPRPPANKETAKTELSKMWRLLGYKGDL